MFLPRMPFRPALALRSPLAALALVAAPVLALAAPAACAQGTGSGFDAYLAEVGQRAQAQGVSAATVSRVLTGLTPNPRVVSLDQAQPGRSNTPPPLAPYLAQHNGPSIVARGRARLASVGALAGQIEARYGVPAEVLFAIWGHETNYGSYTGDFDLARSLATLAYEGRRRALFEGELIAVMKMVDAGVPSYRLKGSWAGAFGNPQFLPSVYLRIAQDWDGDGARDIWGSDADTLASIAAYFRDAGWRSGEPWGVRASLGDGVAASSFATRLAAPSCDRVHARHGRWMTVAEWRAAGVTPQRAIGDSVMASLFQPDGPGTPAWLITGNYRVILQYNCSNYYAMSVGILADDIGR